MKNTRGFGLVSINVIGISQLRHDLFVNNTNPGEYLNVSLFTVRQLITYDSANQLGGAAVFIFFDYHDQTIHQENQFMLNFQECVFTLNAECSVTYFNVLRLSGRGESEECRV